jgi:hypothetical protein
MICVCAAFPIARILSSGSRDRSFLFGFKDNMKNNGANPARWCG